MSIGDFHTHSTRSDGLLTPSELVDLAASRGVRVMALTDHDTLDGLGEAEAAAARHPGFLLVPGVELSCDVPHTEVHMLGLFVDRTNERLVAELARFREGRIGRARGITEALDRLGVSISWDRVQELAGEASIGRPHIAQVLRERGHVQSIEEAFDRYIGRDGPAYVERVKLEPAEAIAMIRDARGLPIFAHPSFTKEWQNAIAPLVQHGLFGMEAYYKAYEPALVAELATFAADHSLFALGGSDYHALDRSDEREPGDIPLPDPIAERFLQAARDQGCAVPEPAPAA